MGIPQAIAYGLIAFAPLEASGAGEGLRAAFVTAVVFGLWCALAGRNPTLVGGPRAMTALLVAGTIAETLSRGLSPELAVAAGFAAVALSGVIQIAFALARLGRLVAFVPNPVLLGFLNASAILVIVSQIPVALGLSVAHAWPWPLAKIASEPVLLAGLTAGVTIVMQPRSKALPGALIGITLGTVCAYLLPVLGPAFSGFVDLPRLDLETMVGTAPIDTARLMDRALWTTLWTAILPAAFAIALLGSFDTVLSLAALGSPDGRPQDPDGELLRHGLGNVAMGLLGGLPGSGTLTRSISIRDAGSVGRAAPALAAILTAGAVLGFGGLLGLIPMAVSAGLLIGTSILAIDAGTLNTARRLVLGRIERPRLVLGDLAVTTAVILVAVAFGLITAVGAGILLAALLFVFGLGRGLIRRVQRGDRIRSRLLRPQEELTALERHGHSIRLIELEGALFFGSCDLLEAQCLAAQLDGVRYLILDLRRLNSVDSTGAACLARLASGFSNRGGALFLAHLEREQRHLPGAPRLPVETERRSVEAGPRWIWLKLAENGLFADLPTEHCFADADSALAEAENRLLAELGISRARGASLIRHQAMAILDGLDRSEIRLLARHARTQRVAAGETLFRKGDTDSTAWLLLSGRAEIRLPIPGSRRTRRLATIVPGGVFGEMAMLDGQPRSADVVAIEKARCVGLDAAGFAEIRSQAPELALKLTANLCRLFADRLRLANTMIAELER